MSCRLAAACASAALLLVAGAACSKDTPPASSEPGADAPVVKLLKDPAPIGDFTLTDIEGRTISSADLRGKVVLVNFWATWCPPCVEELPLLDYFFQENRDKNIQVVGLAVDQPSKVRDWLQATPLHFPVGMAGMGGTELSKSLGNLAGSLPFTAVFSATGELLHRKIGQVLPEELALWAKLK
jgi:thiol-disulfide isomerase/thioredoxin